MSICKYLPCIRPTTVHPSPNPSTYTKPPCKPITKLPLQKAILLIIILILTSPDLLPSHQQVLSLLPHLLLLFCFIMGPQCFITALWVEVSSKDTSLSAGNLLLYCAGCVLLPNAARPFRANLFLYSQKGHHLLRYGRSLLSAPRFVPSAGTHPQRTAQPTSRVHAHVRSHTCRITLIRAAPTTAEPPFLYLLFLAEKRILPSIYTLQFATAEHHTEYRTASAPTRFVLINLPPPISCVQIHETLCVPS